MTHSDTTHIARMMRRQKRPGNILIFIFMGWIILGGVWQHYLKPLRSVRDMMRLTAFHSVEVVLVNWTPTAVTLRGTMVKRRCRFEELRAVVIGPAGYSELAVVDTSAEDKIRPSGDRPPAGTPQAWGPWVIRDETPDIVPTGWEIWTVHQCPDGMQTNLFASGDWPAGEGQ